MPYRKDGVFAMTVTDVFPRTSGTTDKELIDGSVVAGMLATVSPASAYTAAEIMAFRACTARYPLAICLGAAGAYLKAH